MNKKCLIVMILLLIEISSVFLMYKTIGNKKILLENVKLNEETKSDKIALMLEQDDETYKESENASWPKDGYKLNNELSGCIDNNGNKIENALTYTDGVINLKTKTNAQCYLYFDIKHICEDYNDASSCLINTSDDIWESTLEEDGYRYVGTNPDNYICFGTTDIKECTSDTDKYMYRIIGIFEDSSGNQHLKLIKKEALNTAYAWHSDNTVDIDWDESDLYNGINGSYFLTNTEYSYMQDTSWKEMITDWDYTATNTKIYDNYNLNSVYGPYYSYDNSKVIYLHEMNRDSKTNETCYYDATTEADCSVGEWKEVTSKISLMYVSDYMLSLGNDSLNLTSINDSEILKTGWMHLSNNDTSELSTSTIGPPQSYDWTMSRGGIGSGGVLYRAFRIDSSGIIGINTLDSLRSTRPVFYLNSDVEIINGSGTSEEPFIVE